VTAASSGGRAFLDTNILVYAADLDADTTKRDIARSILEDAFAEPRAVVSTQVLQEFFVVATRKLGIDAAIARRKVELLSQLSVVQITPEIVLQAIDIHRLHQLSFWDALIVRCASVASCTRVLSEDLQDGQSIDGVRIDNPFG
jgi:predicted nucleic acid-binding protein